MSVKIRTITHRRALQYWHCQLSVGNEIEIGLFIMVDTKRRYILHDEHSRSKADSTVWSVSHQILNLRLTNESKIIATLFNRVDYPEGVSTAIAFGLNDWPSLSSTPRWGRAGQRSGSRLSSYSQPFEDLWIATQTINDKITALKNDVPSTHQWVGKGCIVLPISDVFLHEET